MLGYLRANPDNAKEVKKLFLELEGDRKRVWDEQQHASASAGNHGGRGTGGCFGSGLGMITKKKKMKGPAPGVSFFLLSCVCVFFFLLLSVLKTFYLNLTRDLYWWCFKV